jgi:hypothetical protein
VKEVTNNNGRTDLASAWTLYAAGVNGLSGTGTQHPVQNRATLGPQAVKANVAYALSESGPVPYVAGSWSCTGFTNGGSQNVNSVTLKPGESVTCTITNDDYDFVGQGSLTKSATASSTTTYTWTIEKSSQTTQLTLNPAQTASVDYQVILTPTPHTTSTVTGSVTLQNTLGGALTIGSISDVLKPGNIPVILTCTIDGAPATIPGPLPVGKTLVCTFTKAIQGSAPTSNEAIAVVDGTSYTVTKPVTPGTTVEVDECVTLDDDRYVLSLGTVCAGDIVKTKSYSLTIGPYQACGEFPFVNTASFDTTDTHATGSDQWTVMVSVVQCVHGCTYTQGYYKNHHDHPAWDLITPDGGDSDFFINHWQSWFEVLDTNPGGGQFPSKQAYYILAHQYIAAKLNILKGASSTPDVDAAITWAESFFNTYTQYSTIPQAVRNQAKDVYAPLLDDYNNGLIGPGHCGDEIVGMMQSESSEELLLGGEEIGLMEASGPIEETTTPAMEEVTAIEETEVVEATPTPVAEVTEQVEEQVVIEATPTPDAEVTEQVVEEVVTEATPTPVEETPTPPNP